MLALVKAVSRHLNNQAGYRVKAGPNGPDPRDPGIEIGDRLVTGSGGSMPVDLATIRSTQERLVAGRWKAPLVAAESKVMREWTAPHGDEWRITALDESLQADIDTFWRDPENILARYLPAIASALGSYGTLYLPAVLADAATGQVVFGYTDPVDITATLTAENNGARLQAVTVTQGPGKPDLVVPVINGSLEMSRRGRLEGVYASGAEVGELLGMLVYRINNLPNECYGIPDLAASVDGLAGLDTVMSNELSAAMVRSGLHGTVEFEGSSDPVASFKEMFADRLDTLSGMIPHNEKTAVKMEPAKHGGTDLRATDRTLSQHYMAPARIPMHVIKGDMGEGTRAVAESAMDPAYLHAKDRAGDIASIIKTAVQMMIDTKLARGMRYADETFQVEGPELLKADMVAGTATGVQASNMNIAAESSGWWGPEFSRRVMARALQGIGMKVTPEDMEGTVEADGAGGEE